MTSASQSMLNCITQPCHSRIVVSANHPTLGALYWGFADGSDHNAPSCYHITDSLEHAIVLQAGWREESMAWRHLDHLAKVLADEEQFEQDYDLDVSEDGAWAQVTQLGGILKVLQERSGQDVEVFADWLTSSVWTDVLLIDPDLAGPADYETPNAHRMQNLT